MKMISHLIMVFVSAITWLPNVTMGDVISVDQCPQKVNHPEADKLCIIVDDADNPPCYWSDNIKDENNRPHCNGNWPSKSNTTPENTWVYLNVDNTVSTFLNRTQLLVPASKNQRGDLYMNCLEWSFKGKIMAKFKDFEVKYTTYFCAPKNPSVGN